MSPFLGGKGLAWAKQNLPRIPLLVNLAWGLFRDPRVPVSLKAVLLGVLAYVASPLDLIPDFIPVIGYLDDLVVVVVGTTLLLKSIKREVVEEHLSRLEADTAPTSEMDEADETIEEIT